MIMMYVKLVLLVIYGVCCDYVIFTDVMQKYHSLDKIWVKKKYLVDPLKG